MSTINRAIVKGRIGGVVATRNMFCAQIDAQGADTIFSIFHEYMDAIWSHAGLFLSTSWHSESMEVQGRSGADWVTIEDSPITLAGTVTGECYPNMVAAVMIGKAIGKRLMGRKFLSPVGETAADGNALTVAAMANLALAVVDYVAPLTTAAGSILTPGVWGKDNAFHSFSSGVVSSLLGTIRRRKPGRGI